MIFSILFLLAVASAAFMGTYRLPFPLQLEERLAYGLVIGVAVGTLVVFLIALIAPLSVSGFLAIAASVALSAVLLKKRGLRTRVRREAMAAWLRFRCRRGFLLTPVFLFFGALLAYLFFGRLLMEGPDGLYAGYITWYGDIYLHMALASSFSFGNNLPPQHPLFAGERLTYPFLVDFLSGLFMEWGTGLQPSMELPGFMLCFAGLLIACSFASRLLRNTWAAVLACAIFFLNGNMGFFYLFQDAQEAGISLWKVLTDPSALPRLTYTNFSDQGLYYFNVLLTSFLSQRATLLGFPLLLIILTLLWMNRHHHDRRIFLATGILAGILPLAHTHTFVVTILLTLTLSVVFPTARWAYFFVPNLALALPQMAYLLPSLASGEGAVKVIWGWSEAVGAEDPWPVFWLKNTGPLLPLLALALIRRDLRLSDQGRFYFPFLLLFAFANLILLQPWGWDNSKILVYWYLGSAIIAARLLWGWFQSPDVYLKLIGAAAVAILVLSTVLDLTRLATSGLGPRIFDWDDLRAASVIMERTSPRSRFLTSGRHDESVVSLAGRPILMGFPGWLWTHGHDYWSRERGVKAMYAGGDEAERLLREYDVSYVVVDKQALEQFGANEEYFASRYPILTETPWYRIYEIK